MSSNGNQALKEKLRGLLDQALDEATIRVEDLGHRDLIELIKASSDALDKLEKTDLQQQKFIYDIESSGEEGKPQVSKKTLGIKDSVDLSALLGGAK